MKLQLRARLKFSVLILMLLPGIEVSHARNEEDSQAAGTARTERNKEKLANARKLQQDARPKGPQSLKDKAVRERVLRRMREADKEHLEAVRERAGLKGLKTSGVRRDGRGFRLVDFDDNDQPVYEIEENVNAAISTAADVVRDNAAYQPVSVRVEAENYTSMSGIELEDCSDTDGGLNIAYISNGDWCEYTVDVPAAGLYRLSFRTASNNNDSGSIELAADGASIGSIEVPDTDGWQAWTTVSTQVEFASSGSHTLRLDFVGGAGSLFNVNWFSFRRNITIGLWEVGGVPRTTHQELEGKVVVMDDSTSVKSHATHVAGTLVAEGLDSRVIGMNPGADVGAFDTADVNYEMTAYGAYEPNSTMLYVSNHSYGVGQGWEASSSDDRDWVFFGTFVDDDDPSTDYDEDFGRYSSSAVTWDSLTYSQQYHLPFISAGNQRTDNPSNGDIVRIYGTYYVYDDSKHPLGDRYYKGDWDNMEGRKLAKNVITVGNTSDAVSGGVRDPGGAVTKSSSSRGPADDGRIKPDIVGNGDSVRSCDSDSDTDTSNKTGTSMSTPNVCGSASLLIDYFVSRFPERSMTASTLKALILHTADDRGNPGPDYKYGWGLMNTEAAVSVIEDYADSSGGGHMLESVVDESANPLREYSFAWDGSAPLRVTLCWTDPAGTEKSGHENREKALVNDLNLRITGPDGTHYPYVMPHVGDWSIASIEDNATTGVNDVDNVEQVYLETPEAGDYTVTVDYAGSLADDSQPFSLIVTGQSAAEIEVDEDGPPVVALVSDGAARDFGSAAPSHATVSQYYTIRNSGGSPLTDLSLAVEGSASSDFTVSGLSATELFAGESATFAVSYDPLDLGTRSARLEITSNDSDENPFVVNLTAIGLSELEGWRLEHFGSAGDSGEFADDADFDRDGNSNLIEFLMATNPTIANPAPLEVDHSASTFDLTYDRNVNALGEFDFQVEWNDDLMNSDGWFDTGVSEEVLSDDGTVQEVKASAPKGTATSRFYHLKVAPK
ncbi:MAG: carbohydrate-binding protein [Verrucomicrobiota bacterium JB025]|nr:carbohydrate-binding protein [Verrucomicrobiota bacterium JB025]